MGLSPGTRLGPYEITGQIGAGGMGEVYRATDPNLGRQVAIKVLPDAIRTTLSVWLASNGKPGRWQP
jgi:eukaryotic-like serine/threonine-protein kinase